MLVKMSMSKELLHISTTTRMIGDHMRFLHDFEEDEIRYGHAELPRPRLHLKDRQNPLTMRPNVFRSVFGMSREAFKELLSLLEPQLKGERDGWKGNLLPIHRLCIFLQFLRTNSFHKSVGSQHHIRVDQALVTRTVNYIAKIISQLVPKYVKFPSVEEGNTISQEIFDDTGFPGCIGIIDGVKEDKVLDDTAS